ncbi:uncharacterized protein LODBEIA_P09640 [Lodderomyces beijingensis]|uniref:NFACT RNA-binding domain-containing protein n=1 Tax=Lodderomyces beijingensis TaxID=1775926 RepID=A0ABP0ZHW3_9ASCO
MSLDILDKQLSELNVDETSSKVLHQKQLAGERLKKAKTKRDDEIQALKDEQELNIKKGELIQLHAALVDECRQYIRKYLDQSMDWTNIELAVKLEKKRKHGVAKHVDLPLHLKDNSIQIRLQDPDAKEVDESDSESDESESDTVSDSELESESESEPESESSDSESDNEDANGNEIGNGKEEDDSALKSKTKSKSKSKSKSPSKPIPKTKTKNKTKRESAKGVPVMIDITQSSFANARNYFDSKKAAESLQLKVQKGAEAAYRKAEKKISEELVKNIKRENGLSSSKEARTKFWFEKFYWFTSSEGYLCLAGTDKKQTDMIYFKYFGDDDFFVSSEMEGSLKVFIKNPIKGESIPPSTILQAGIFAMCASQAWNGKVNTAAWVLHATEITKYDSASGNLLPAGSFEYLAKKKFLPPAQLVMGFGFYCQVDPESKQRHASQRTEREREHGLVYSLSNGKKALENLNVTNVKENKELNKENKTPSCDATGVEGEGENEGDSALALAMGQASRGKKTKLKKAASKYADQDEEEKLLRMQVLGSNKSKNKDKKSVARSSSPATSNAPSVEELERRKQHHQQDVEKYLLDDQAATDLAQYFETMDELVPKPLASDTIIDLVPVFAPWSALQKFKYKVKIQPGLAKKGKCTNEILNYFTSRKLDSKKTDTDLDWPEERDIINSLRPTELLAVFPVNKMRLVLPQNKK